MRPIDADALITVLVAVENDYKNNGDIIREKAVGCTIKCLESELISPTLDCKPATHGKWKYFGISPKMVPISDMLQCSECFRMSHRYVGVKYEFCPFCGAKMDGKEAGNDAVHP